LNHMLTTCLVKHAITFFLERVTRWINLRVTWPQQVCKLRRNSEFGVYRGVLVRARSARCKRCCRSIVTCCDVITGVPKALLRDTSRSLSLIYALSESSSELI
jgi:hypothetical protein